MTRPPETNEFAVCYRFDVSNSGDAISTDRSVAELTDTSRGGPFRSNAKFGSEVSG